MPIVEMNVPASKSIKMIGAKWAMGSLYRCEAFENTESLPDDAVVHWQDSGAILCLRPQNPALTSESEGWAEAGKLASTTYRGIWHIAPNTWVKVNSWQPGVQLEGSTIKFINNKHPEIPTTRVIHEWIDPAWTRSFMIMQRARGVLMDEVLVHMTESQIRDVAAQVAAHVKTLTQHTSDRMETIDNSGVPQGRLVGLRPLSCAVHEPSWLRIMWPRLTREEFNAHLRQASNMESLPDVGSEFVLYNADLTTHNIFVHPPYPGGKGQLAEIIDWEYTSYWPRYWVATCPQPEGAFVFRQGCTVDRYWPDALHAALVKAGFEDQTKWWLEFESASDELRQARAGKEYHDWLVSLNRGA